MIGVSGGSGAPIRNESGRAILQLREDPSITFGDSTRNFVDKDLRYRTTASEQKSYRQDLDRMVEEKKRLKYDEKFGRNSGYNNVSQHTSNDCVSNSLKSMFIFRSSKQIHGESQDRVEKANFVVQSMNNR